MPRSESGFSALLVMLAVLYAQPARACAPDTGLACFIADGVVAYLEGVLDPGILSLRLESGEILDTRYVGIDDREVERMPRGLVLRVHWALARGTWAVDGETGRVLELPGFLDPHPIDIASARCQNTWQHMQGAIRCQQLAVQAWNREFERAYARLGGDGDTALRDSVQQWRAYREAHLRYLQRRYDVPGSLWRLVHMDHVVRVTRDQAQRLQALYQR